MQKRTELEPAILLAAIATQQIPESARIVWRKENIIYLATIESIFDMIGDEPPVKFEIWMPESLPNDLKN